MSDLQKLVGMKIVKVDDPEYGGETFFLKDEFGEDHILRFDGPGEGVDVVLDDTKIGTTG